MNVDNNIKRRAFVHEGKEADLLYPQITPEMRKPWMTGQFYDQLVHMLFQGGNVGVVLRRAMNLGKLWNE